MTRAPVRAVCACVVLALSWTLAGVSPARGAASTASITAVLGEAASAWSAGSLDRFMTSYERSPETLYVSGARVVRGWSAIRAMYAARFGGGASLGTLALAVEAVRPLGRDDAFCLAAYRLVRAGAPVASGVTTLIFHRTAAGWRISVDHSSS